MSGNLTGVLLGRFAPLHKGHQLLINHMIERHGAEKSLVVIGSSTSLNNRTPYNFEQRKEMIHSLYPDLEVIDLPDTKPELETHGEDDIDMWLERIKKIEKDRNTQFIFYGGSEADLQYLSRAFPTEVIVDRAIEGKSISATNIRSALASGNEEQLTELLPKAVIPLAKQTTL